jgi:benzoyl-CoA reductase/2-hydroxyglutaryl-CoA dehydratase subunit BcrC/BadD/HgdB
VEKIIVCANHLEHKGMLAILNSLTVNNSIQQLFIRSYNVHHHRYNWTTEEVQALVKVISTNKSLKSIKVPDNVIDSSEIHYLMKAYETNDFEHANISGFEVGLNRLPDFNHENVKNNEELKEWFRVC